MTKEEKQLLLVDLSARLPYGVICYGVTKDTDEDGNYINKGVTDILYELHSYKCCYGLVGLMNECDIESIKPYLRPMPSMNEEEDEEYRNIDNRSYSCPMIYAHILASERIDWLNVHHFDYRGLIEKGLAIEVTKENNPYKN